MFEETLVISMVSSTVSSISTRSRYRVVFCWSIYYSVRPRRVENQRLLASCFHAPVSSSTRIST